MAKRKPLGEMLVDGGFMNQQELQECIDFGQQANRRLGDIAVERGFVTEEEVTRLLENQTGVTFIDLDRTDPDIDVTKHVPVELARSNNVAPVRVAHNVLYIAIEDPKNFHAIDDVSRTSRMQVQPMLASGKSIRTYIDRIYGSEFAQRALSDYGREVDLGAVANQVVELGGADDTENAPIVRLVTALMEQAVNMRASDVHVEPGGQNVRVRMRVDGRLQQVLQAPAQTAAPMVARLKIISGLNIAERRVPQDGRFNIRVLNREIDIRISILPTVHGEKVVMRLLDRSTFLVPKSKLGFTERNLKLFDELLTSPHGIVLVTGPTGSGKSTTLYTMLAEINTVTENIITIEDPVEFMIEGLNQVHVNARAGMDFASGLRSMLRQDPDVIMIGEIRDAETVEIAVRAAITGHLVLSTIHTNDTVSTVYRLIDMGIPSYMIAASVVGIVAQRLLRVICPHCKTTYTPNQNELEMAGIESWSASETKFYKGMGCAECNNNGYKGRMAVHEILIFDSTLRELVHNNASVGELRKYALEQGMHTLRDSIFDLLNQGLTTLEELIAIAHGM